MNKITLMGNVGRDPAIRSSAAGERFATFSLATDDRWKDQATGERRQRTQWHEVVVFNPGIVSVVERFLTKGARLLIEGTLGYNEYTDGAGIARRTASVILGPHSEFKMLDRPAAPEEMPTKPPHRAKVDLDDEIPF